MTALTVTHISTLSTKIPQGVVASSSSSCNTNQSDRGELELYSPHLHTAGDTLSLTQDLMQVLGTQDIPQGSLGQQPGGVVGVLHVGHGDGGVGHPVEHHGVH